MEGLNKNEEVKKEINILSQEEYNQKLKEIQNEIDDSNGLASDENMLKVFLKGNKFKSENMTKEMFEQFEHNKIIEKNQALLTEQEKEIIKREY